MHIHNLLYTALDFLQKIAKRLNFLQFMDHNSKKDMKTRQMTRFCSSAFRALTA